jgi:hypothetical protein
MPARRRRRPAECPSLPLPPRYHVVECRPGGVDLRDERIVAKLSQPPRNVACAPGVAGMRASRRRHTPSRRVNGDRMTGVVSAATEISICASDR